MNNTPGIFRSYASLGMFVVQAALVVIALLMLYSAVNAETDVYYCRVDDRAIYNSVDEALTNFTPAGVTPMVKVAYVMNGDINGDGTVTQADIIQLVMYVLKGGPAPYVDSLPAIVVYQWPDTTNYGVRERLLLISEKP